MQITLERQSKTIALSFHADNSIAYDELYLAVQDKMSAIVNGGKFFVGKAFTIVGNAVSVLSKNIYVQGLTVAAAGGLGSRLAGGSFELGFLTAGLAFAVNRVVTELAQQNRVTTTTSVDEATGAHRYTISGAICQAGPGCDNAYADQVFGHVNANDVPFSDNDLGSGLKNLIAGVPRPFGNQPIFHSENIAQRTSVNVALEGHNFYPGSVTHSVIFRGGTLFYDLVGTGTGRFPSFNNSAGVFLFRPGVVDAVNTFGR